MVGFCRIRDKQTMGAKFFVRYPKIKETQPKDFVIGGKIILKWK
jgi:hypothetical protein